MNELAHPLCLARGIWRSVLTGTWVSGHEYATSNEPTPANVHILECKTCGHTSVAWSWDSMEGVK